MKLSLCIPSYRRPERLSRLLLSLTRQRRLPDEVVIVDNDAGGSARAAVEAFAGAPFALRYDIQPVQNISLARNRSIELASGDWLGFIDDDEYAPPEWLERLVQAARAHEADGVLGPVLPEVPAEAPEWIRRGDFYSWTRLPTGSVVPRNRLRFGNLILRAALVRGPQPPFDPHYGLTGGEDGALLSRLAQQGARLIWCDEAVVHEPVVPARLSLRWLLLRALRGGQDFARHSLAGRYGPLRFGRAGFFARAALQMLAAGALALLSWPLGRHRAAYWLLKAAANLGKLSMFWGWHYREYASAT